ncbi:MAG: GGDEF domain-containing protein [Desulfobacteraceae bacterium]|nr:GGDEF domain-containing protein [Desulfobacteraceae bacterium]
MFKRQKLTPRVIRDLKKRSTTGAVFYIIAICIVLFTDGYYFRYSLFSKQFFGLVILISFFRLFHRLIDHWIPDKLNRASLIVFIASIILSGLIWGAGFAGFVLQEGEQNVNLLMTICTMGICSGGVLAYTPVLWLSIAFNLLMLGPGIVLMLVNQVNLPLSALMALYSVYMAFMASRANNEYWGALENEFLLEEKTKDLEKISQKDGLTSLYNRRYFDTAFALEWKRGRRNQTGIAMMICDIDDFKQVNDAFGHLAGDEYLKLTARILDQVFQRESDIVARYGGDEFVALMPEASLENMAALSEKVRKKMAETPLKFESHTIHTSVSLGVAAITPQRSGEKELLIARADAALYTAKKNGRNQVHVYGI